MNFNNRLVKEKTIWESNKNTAKILKTKESELAAARKWKGKGGLIEGIHYKKTNKNNKRSPIKYNLQETCKNFYGVKLTTFIHPNFDYNLYLAKEFDKANKTNLSR